MNHKKHKKGLNITSTQNNFLLTNTIQNKIKSKLFLIRMSIELSFAKNIKSNEIGLINFSLDNSILERLVFARTTLIEKD